MVPRPRSWRLGYSGALIGAGIDADGIEIWTAVDGMLTADPRIVEKPLLVPQLSFAEAAELAHARCRCCTSTILPAVERGIPVRILNSRRPEGLGTIITGRRAMDARPVAALAGKKD